MAVQPGPPLGARPQVKFGTDGRSAGSPTISHSRTCATLPRGSPTTSSGPDPAVIGYDCRFGADRFAAEVARVTAAAGIKTYLTDAPSPTQVSSWTILELHASGGRRADRQPQPRGNYLGIKYKPEYAGSASPEVVASPGGGDRQGLRCRLRPAGRPRRYANRQQHRDDRPRPAYTRQVGKMVDLDVIKAAGLAWCTTPCTARGRGTSPTSSGRRQDHR